MKMEVEYPETLPDLLHLSKEIFEKEAKMAMAVKLFEMKRISSGVAAQIAGMNRVDFLLGLNSYGVPMINFEPEELATDVKNA